ncbi:unnamed protein product [Callosobruchus maculatus]|uniref:Histone H2A/H2B/H3 domain-containing protein n=1 Tax=Callosobruchus maculatus TaxID=64391 RepID=A0A653BGJ1_CALMS|nr:unnamed protein product [Callosobruchus maculatus]
MALQEASEAYLVGLFEDTNLLPFTLSGLPSCQKIYNWLDASEVNVPKVSPSVSA